MSSLRNAVKRVAHKERAQPAARKKLGLLEKHKDYVERSRDFHKKQDYIKTLKRKAEERNPDEFYFKMNNSKVVNGVHKEIKDKSLDTSTVQHLKTQDLGYVIHKKAVNDRKVERMKKNLHMIGDKKVMSHKIFVDDEKDVESFNLATHFDTSPALAKQAHNRVKIETIEKHVEASRGAVPTAAAVKKTLEKRTKTYKELDQRVKRAQKLSGALQTLSTQRNIMGKGSKRKISSAADEEDDEQQPVVYKWKRERKR